MYQCRALRTVPSEALNVNPSWAMIVFHEKSENKCVKKDYKCD